MRVRHYAQGKFYVIECPEGTRVVRRSEQSPGRKAVLHDHRVVPLNGNEIRIPADPPELLPLLAESGDFGVSLVGGPVPDVKLEGASCPQCGEDDVTWLQPMDGTETAHCDFCGVDFALPVPRIGSRAITERLGG